MVADVEPRPAIEGARFDMGDVVGRQVVPQPVALVDRAEQRSGFRLDRLTRTVAQPGCKGLRLAAVQPVGEHIRTPLLVAPGSAEPVRGLPRRQAAGWLGWHAAPEVARRADRDIERAAVRRGSEV